MASVFHSREQSESIASPNWSGVTSDHNGSTLVLLVDDNPMDVCRFKCALAAGKGTTFEVVVQHRLQDALQYLRRPKNREPVQIIVLDLGLPDRPGVEAVQDILRQTPHIPIVVLTEMEEEAMGRQALRFGAQDYLCKVALKPQILIPALNHAIERQQILERLRTSQSHLAEQETFLRSIMDASPTLIAVKDRSGIYVVVNDALAQLYGTTSEAMVGAREQGINPNQSQANLHAQEEQKVLRDGCERAIAQEPFQTPEGAVRWFHSVRRPLRNGSGEAEWVLVVMTDVTARQEAERTLWEQAERARLLGQITQQVRESLQLSEILQTAASQVLQFLEVDRVMLYRVQSGNDAYELKAIECASRLCGLDEDGGAGLVPVYKFWSWLQGMSQDSPRDSSNDSSNDDSNDYSDRYGVVGFRSRAGMIQAIEDWVRGTAGNGISPDDILTQLELREVRSLLVVPILTRQHFLAGPLAGPMEKGRLGTGPGGEARDKGEPGAQGDRDQLWGLLVAHNCVGERPWPQWEREFLESLSGQLAIAIQQATLYDRLCQANQKLEQLATLDGLTGIPNRRSFDQTLEQEWQRSHRNRHPLALIVGDIDFFKAYNDHYGHLAGDDCLRQVAQTLARVARRSTDLAFRYGGEEFAIILPNTDLEGAIAVAHQILEALCTLGLHHAHSKVAQRVTLSLGVTAIIPGPKQQPDTLIQRADEALFMAKDAGRNQAIALNSLDDGLDNGNVSPIQILLPELPDRSDPSPQAS